MVNHEWLSLQWLLCVSCVQFWCKSFNIHVAKCTHNGEFYKVALAIQNFIFKYPFNNFPFPCLDSILCEILCLQLYNSNALLIFSFSFKTNENFISSRTCKYWLVCFWIPPSNKIMKTYLVSSSNILNIQNHTYLSYTGISLFIKAR